MKDWQIPPMKEYLFLSTRRFLWEHRSPLMAHFDAIHVENRRPPAPGSIRSLIKLLEKARETEGGHTLYGTESLEELLSAWREKLAKLSLVELTFSSQKAGSSSKREGGATKAGLLPPAFRKNHAARPRMGGITQNVPL